MGSNSYAGVDYFRLPAAVMVVAIHTAPFSIWSGSFDFLVTYCLGRVAVPFFLMVTGYFVLGPYVESGFRDRRRLGKYLRNCGLLYLAATVLYLPVNLYAGKLPSDVWGALKALFFDGTFYHLWYFPAAMIGCVLVVLLMRFSMKAAGVCVLAAYVLGMLGDSYYGLIKDIPWLNTVYEGIFSVSSYTRNGIFFTPVFLFLGLLLSRGRNRCTALMCRWGLAGSLVLLLAEGYVTYSLGLQKHNSMYVFLLPVMYFLFTLLLEVKGRAPGWLRRGSMLVYCVHPAVIVLVRAAASVVGLNALFVGNSLIHFVTVCLLSFGLTVPVLFLLSWISKRRYVCVSERKSLD